MVLKFLVPGKWNYLESILTINSNLRKTTKRLRSYLTLDKARPLGNSFIDSKFNYAPLVWMFARKTTISNIFKIHYRTLQIVYNNFTDTYDALLPINADISVYGCWNVAKVEIFIFITGPLELGGRDRGGEGGHILSLTLMCPFSNHKYASFPNLILFHLVNYWLVLIYDLTVSGLLKIKLVCSVCFHRVRYKILASLQ